MLFPFTKRHPSIPDLGREYLPTLLQDLTREEFSGYALLLGPESTVTVVMSRGEPVAAAEFAPPRKLFRLKGPLGRRFFSLPDRIGVEVLEAPEDAVAMTRCFCRTDPVWREPGAWGLSSALDRFRDDDLLMVSRQYDLHTDFAALRRGRLEVGYRFSRTAGIHERVDGDDWLRSAEEPIVCEISRPGEMVYPAPVWSEWTDPLALAFEKYEAVLNKTLLLLGELHPEGSMEVLRQLLDEFKRKYPPLYRGIYLNPETNRVNWNWLIESRSKVNHTYRYEKFFLYLDELLLRFIQVLFEKTGIDGIKRLREDIAALREASPDIEQEPVRQVFRKVEKLLKMS